MSEAPRIALEFLSRVGPEGSSVPGMVAALAECLVPGVAGDMTVFVPSLAPDQLVIVAQPPEAPLTNSLAGLADCAQEFLTSGVTGRLDDVHTAHLRFGTSQEPHDRSLDWTSIVFSPIGLPGHAPGAIVFSRGPDRLGYTDEDAVMLQQVTNLCAPLILATSLSDHQLFDRDLALNLPDAVIAVDPEFRVLRWNPAAERLYGIGVDCAIGSPLRSLYTTFYDDPDMDADQAWEQLQRTGRWEGHVTQQSKAGKTLSVFAAVAAVRDDTGRLIGAVALNRDNTDIIRARSRFDIAEDLLAGALDAAGAMAVVLDDRGTIVAANREWLDIALATGARMDMVSVGADYLRPVSEAAAAGESAAETALDNIHQVINGTASILTSEYRCDRPDGPHWYHMEVRRIGSASGAVVTHREVTERHRLERLLAHRETHDSLTGLGNRSLLERRVRRSALNLGDAADDLGLIVCDIDGFSAVNEALGYPCGDEVLTIVADRIREGSPPAFVTFRLGGDQFAVFTEATRDVGSLPVVAERLRNAFASEPIEIAGRRISLTLSAGVATVTVRGPDVVADLASELITRADAARLESKAQGRNRVQRYRPDLRDRTASLLHLRHEFATALNAGALEFHYQQIRRVADDSVAGFEALVRWPRPGGPVQTPAMFGPVLGEPIIAGPLARWGIKTAIRDALILREAFSPAEVQVGVNISAQQFLDLDVAATLETAIGRASLAPSAIVIEVTETTAFTDDGRVLAQLARIHESGFWIALDDFGTGFSSLAHLRSLPVDAVKVDRTFTMGVGSDPASEALVRALIGLAHDLGLRVVAEGVESQEQLAWLADNDCDSYQGFLAHRPSRISKCLPD